MGLRFYLSGFAIFSGFACPPPVVARRSHTPARESARRQGSSSQSHAPNNATHQTMPTPDPCIICTLQHDFMRQQQCIPLTPELSDTLQVRTLIDAQKALNEEAPRIIYGRSNAMQELKVHEHAMNAAALTCYQLLQLVSGGHLNSSAPRGKQKSEFSICSCAA